MRAELGEVKDVLGQQCVAISMMFIYYSNMAGGPGPWTSAGALAMTMEAFRLFVRDTFIINPKGRSCRTMSELDAVFVVCPETRLPPQAHADQGPGGQQCEHAGRQL